MDGMHVISRFFSHKWPPAGASVSHGHISSLSRKSMVVKLVLPIILVLLNMDMVWGIKCQHGGILGS